MVWVRITKWSFWSVMNLVIWYIRGAVSLRILLTTIKFLLELRVICSCKVYRGQNKNDG